MEIATGKLLSEARIARGLNVEEAAHATKMRPDKIMALENDDLARFGSAAYARGFLLIYGRFLGVDVSHSLRELDEPRRVPVEEYQYLNNAPEPPPAVRMPVRRRERRPPSIVPLLVFVCLCGLAIVVTWAVIGARRLELNKPASNPVAPAAPGTSDAPEPAEHRLSPKTEPVAIAPVQAVADRTAPAPAITADADAGGNINEIVVEPLKKTMVTIRRGSPTAKPIFEDFLYPHAPPLRLRGAKFFVEVQDQAAVQIRKNGHPIAYQAPGISIP